MLGLPAGFLASMAGTRGIGGRTGHSCMAHFGGRSLQSASLCSKLSAAQWTALRRDSPRRCNLSATCLHGCWKRVLVEEWSGRRMVNKDQFQSGRQVAEKWKGASRWFGSWLWKFQRFYGSSKDFFVPLEWKFREGGKICEGSNFEIAVTVISRTEIAPLIARFLIWVGEHPLLQSQSCHPRRFFHPRGTSTQVAQKNLWKFQKRLELPNAFGTSTQVAHKLHTQPRPTISRACPCHCPFRGARARAIPRRKSVNHRNTQDKVRRMARKAARVPMANAPLASNLLPVGRAPFRIRPL